MRKRLIDYNPIEENIYYPKIEEKREYKLMENVETSKIEGIVNEI